MMEGSLIYRREEAADAASAQALAAAEPAPGPTEYTVPAGTHILLNLSNPISTKNSKEGDRVYLETAVPVARDGRIVIPRGSYVKGSITKAKPAGRESAKSELYIRFESLTLPNGVSRDFRARLSWPIPPAAKWTRTRARSRETRAPMAARWPATPASAESAE